MLDFEPGLYRRERAAYLLSEHLQWFIEADGGEHYFTLYADAPETHPALPQIAVFDCLANNTDRKSGQVLRGPDGHIWGIDNGLCFATANKLCTVIGDFAGRPIPDAQLEDIAALADAVPSELVGLLDDGELAALGRRAQRLLREGVLPEDPTCMRYPWPLV